VTSTEKYLSSIGLIAGSDCSFFLSQVSSRRLCDSLFELSDHEILLLEWILYVAVS